MTAGVARIVGALDMMSLFLACLFVTATVACSCVVLRNWRRGKPSTELLCARCLKAHEPVCETPADLEFKTRLLEALEQQARLRAYGSYLASASAAAPPTAGTTAASTTTGTGGSPDPDSGAIPAWQPGKGWPPPRIQHNPHSGRIDASSRKQFGMCDYPD